jgi:hypothetical protein
MKGVTSIRGNGIKVKSVDMVSRYGRMGPNMKAFGRITLLTVRENLITQTVISTRGT